MLAGNGEVRHYTGGYADYRADVAAERQRLAAQQRLDSQPLPNSSPKKPSGGRSHQEKLKFSFKEQREYEEIDGVIAGLEEKIAQTEVLIAQNASDYAALQELTAEKEELGLSLPPRWSGGFISTTSRSGLRRRGSRPLHPNARGGLRPPSALPNVGAQLPHPQRAGAPPRTPAYFLA